MKVLLHGKNSKNIEKLVKETGFEVVKVNPDTVISYGGDGTLLSAERTYPGIPKLPIRDSLICKKCPNHEESILLKKLLEGKLKLEDYKKLITTFFYKNFYALNDFVVRNSSPIHTIRFKTSIKDRLLIGDGIVVSTPFGSTGYFKSITGQSFEKSLPAGRQGFGLAFNNTTEKVPPVYLENKDTVTFQLIRGRATLSFDNSPDIFTIDESSELQFKLSDQTAKIYELESLRCLNCKVTRG